MRTPSSISEDADSDDEEDEWLAFDEGEERDDFNSREEMVPGLEEMLSAEDEADLWDVRTCRNCAI
jgi:hypothetical protein